MGMEIVEGEETVRWVNVGHPIVTNGDFVVFCRAGWRRGSSQITLGFLVSLLAHYAWWCSGQGSFTSREAIK